MPTILLNVEKKGGDEREREREYKGYREKAGIYIYIGAAASAGARNLIIASCVKSSGNLWRPLQAPRLSLKLHCGLISLSFSLALFSARKSIIYASAVCSL